MFNDILVFDGGSGARGGAVARRGSGRANDIAARASAMRSLITQGGPADARDRRDGRILAHIARNAGATRGLPRAHQERGRQLIAQIRRDQARRTSTAGQPLTRTASGRAQRELRAEMGVRRGNAGTRAVPVTTDGRRRNRG